MRATLALAFVVSFATAGFVREWILERMLYFPSPGISFDYERAGIQAEQVFLTTEDGVRVHAFHLRAAGATRALVFLHGNAGNASDRLPNADRLRRLGTDVLLLDYRGYGLSEGRTTERGLYADARAGLAQLTLELGFPEERVVVFGRSIGAAVAVDLAQERELAGLILESPFSSLADAGAVHFSRLAAWILTGCFASDVKIPRVHAPLLFFHGDRDVTIPHALGRKLYEVANEPKAFVTLRGADHNDTVEVGGEPYFARIRTFLDEVAP